MTNSKEREFSAAVLENRLFNEMALDNTAPFFIALSGGLDSCVLLHALAHIKPELNITALHVNHGLQAESMQWQQHCVTFCENLGVSYAVTQVDVQMNMQSEEYRGQGIESVARQLRYRWFNKQLEGIKTSAYLLTAHHQQDRAETVLFNLLRGSGSQGLSSMVAQRNLSSGKPHQLVRPLLPYTRKQLEAYALQNRLNWVEDPSNRDLAFSRNYIRHKIIPSLLEFRDDAVQAIVRAADNLQAENKALQELAEQDLNEIETIAYHAVDQSIGLRVTDLLALSDARQRNVLKYWFRLKQLPLLNHHFLTSLLMQLRQGISSTAVLQHNGYQVRCYNDVLYAMPELKERDVSEKKLIVWNVSEKYKVDGWQLSAKEALINLLQKYPDGTFYLMSRCEGLTLLTLDERTLSLKKWMNEQRVPPWRRFKLSILVLESSGRRYFLAVIDPSQQNPWCHIGSAD